ncbi:AdoMet-dependent rRNA methyltransferase spb1 [Quaeritorhiza haematococci]|nr:AdoMet-dependent rRNA methyltransferase spb1 [Quaeritorhiza haematococci]
MGREKRHAKGRLDKYYHMAKEQGYRARSAFKLIQLNKKFNFLERAKCVVDLCAAPGGWLQVASKYMPKPNIIIGLDLAPIKPIPGVITFVEDITTEKCRATLKKELKTWKVDVFLHDGAPNVGTAWLQDAFTQSELVLSALKLATQFLTPRGTFVTKVFRSKDYNKLLWVFHQLFKHVDATKPASSRNVSAEIFVVCRDFLAPKKIDPRLLDAKWVFREVDDEEHNQQLDDKKRRERDSALMNDLLHPEKRKRFREGYDEGNYILHTTANVCDFIKNGNFVELLAKSNEFRFDVDEEGKSLAANPLTTDEIKSLCSDLKVLGKKDVKELLKWRQNIRIALGMEKAKKSKDADAEEAGQEKNEDEDDLLEKLEQESKLLAAQMKRSQRKKVERKAKTLLKLRYGMQTPMDIGLDAATAAQGGLDDADVGDGDPSENRLFMLGSAAQASKKGRLAAADSSSTPSSEDEEEVSDEEPEDSDDEAYDSDEEAARRLARLENQMESLYEEYMARKLEKNPLEKVKEEKKKRKLLEDSNKEEEWYGIDYELNKLKRKREEDGYGSSSDEDDLEGSNGEQDVESEDEEEEEESAQLSKRARNFFDNPLFKDMDGVLDAKSDAKKKKSKKEKQKGLFDQDMEDVDDDEDDDHVPSKEDDDGDFEVVSASAHDDEDGMDDEGYAITTAEEYTLAQKIIRKSGMRDVVDDAYNRYTTNDPEGLPDWFLQDEARHRKVQLPVTKEAVDIIRQRMKALNARPIKKVLEAKARKKTRALRRLEKMQKKAQVIADDEDTPDSSKIKEISKLMARAASSRAKSEKPKVKVVVAKGANRALKGRPRGVKGRYKMVDPRMKKEVRAEKRKTAESRKRRRKN